MVTAQVDDGVDVDVLRGRAAHHLVPWAVAVDHRRSLPLAMLQLEIRRRSGQQLRAADRERLDWWTAALAEQGWVVDYDARTEEGFTYVPRRAVDRDLIREPGAAVPGAAQSDAGAASAEASDAGQVSKPCSAR